MPPNGRLGSVWSPAVGGADADEECSAGEALHSGLLQFDLRFPATVLVGGPTWRSTGGWAHRIDFVAIPSSWGPSVAGTGVLHERTLALQDKVDHMAPFVSVRLAPGGAVI